MGGTARRSVGRRICERPERATKRAGVARTWRGSATVIPVTVRAAAAPEHQDSDGTGLRGGAGFGTVVIGEITAVAERTDDPACALPAAASQERQRAATHELAAGRTRQALQVYERPRGRSSRSRSAPRRGARSWRYAMIRALSAARWHDV